MFHAPRLPYDASLPLVARRAFEHNGSTVEAGSRVEVRDRFEGSTLWRAMLVDCVKPAPVAAADVAAAPVTAAKQPKRARAGA